MIRVCHRTLATAAAALFAVAGCHTAPPAKPSAPPPVVTAPATRAEATARLEPVADQLDLQVAELPGTDGTAHRKLVLAALDTLIQALELANGPDQSPAFINRLGVVKASEAAIADQTIPRPRLEAAENQALVASVDALDEISTRYLFDDDKLPGLVKAARDKVAVALQSQGPMHDLDASAGFSAVDTLVREETDAFIDRFGSFDARTRLATRVGTAPPVAPAAAPMPMASPTTAPAATEPATPTAPTTAPAAPTTAPV